MRSEFGGLSIALRALLAQQQALETTGHNIANANTEGYSRQVVRLRASSAITLPGVEGQLGTGVEVAAVERLRSAFFDNQIRTQSQGLGLYQMTEEFLRQIELVFGEPSASGISGALGRFFNAWREVSSQPEAISARRALIARAQDLATLLNTAARNLTALQRDADQRVQLRVDDVNDLAEQIAVLNDRIARVQAVGDRPNDLRDERDRLLTRLSEIVDVTTSEDSQGRVTVTIGGRNLVQGIDVFRLATTANASGFRDVVWYADNAAATISGGQLYGLRLARDTHLATQLTNLNSLASTLVTQVNTAHAAGFGLPSAAFPTGSTGDDFFDSAGTTASTIAVSSTIVSDPNRIAAASAASRPGDGSNALAIANIQTSRVLSSNTQTIEEFFTGMMTRLGADTQQATLARETQEALVEHMRQQQAARAGVNLDEEAARLIQYQRAYQGAARVMTAIDELIDLVVNGLGRVGR